LRPVSGEEEIVVGVVGDFFFALSLAGTFGPPRKKDEGWSRTMVGTKAG
jgi:hypothetical protein